jgi:hypothetical protein
MRWFDVDNSFIWPQGGGFMAVPADLEPAVELLDFWPQTEVVENSDQILFELSSPPSIEWALEAHSVGTVVSFLGYRPSLGENELSLLTAWRVEVDTERPLKIFVHVLDENGQIITQWDGLGVESTHLEAGDVFVQLHQIQLLPDQDLNNLLVGIYDATTLERLGEPFHITLQ